MIGCSKKIVNIIGVFSNNRKRNRPVLKFNGSTKVSAEPAFHTEVNSSTHLYWSTLTLNHSQNKTASKKLIVFSSEGSQITTVAPTGWKFKIS